jgi:DNA-binding FadR family transcriptional regulator
MSVDKVIFVPVKSQRTFEKVSTQVKTLIFDGVLQPGDKLPSESELAKQFNVGRQTVREALRILELSGFVTVQKGFGGGPIVKDTISSKITNLFLDAFRMENITDEEFTDARLSIEKSIMNDAIDHADEQDIQDLKENVSIAKNIVAKKEVATDANFEFHALLAKASKNKVFVILERAINAIHRDLRDQSEVSFRTTKNAVRAHEDILDAMIKKDRTRALQLLEKHLMAVGKSLKPSEKISK